MIEVSQKCPEVWYIKNIFDVDMYEGILEEFLPCHSQWVFDKHENPNDPIFGMLLDCHDHTESWPYSTNFQFIKASTIAKLHIQKILKRDLELIRINTNIQFHGQDSAFHTDDDYYVDNPDSRCWTLVVFSEYDWDATWGGHVEIQTERDSVDYIALPFMPNCAVLFDGSLYHRGLAPNRFAQCERKTLAFLFKEV